MKHLPLIICGIGVIIGWNTLAILRDNGRTLDIEYRTVHKLYCMKHPQHHHCQ